jgi:predicted outer membrane repeat protein
VGTGAELILKNLVVADGYSANYGGGIANNGTLTVIESTFSGNSATPGGGGIVNVGSLTITDSAFSDNSATEAGGSIANWGTLTITNTTFSGNTATEGGGGIQNLGTLDIINSTFSGNSAAVGGNIHVVTGTATLYSTIMAVSSSGGSCSGPITDGGHNIDEGDTCGFGPNSWSNTDPLLTPLRDNSGPTWTHALLTGSPAIDKADPNHCLPTDQRGFPRPIDGDGDGVAICDVGSFELQYPTSTSITTDDPDPSFQDQPFTVTIIVTSDLGTPTGEVTVNVDSSIGTCIAPLSEGMGNCTISLHTPGTYTLSASYEGDGPFTPSSDTEEHTVSSTRMYLPIINND